MDTRWNHKHTIILISGTVLAAALIICLGLGRFYVSPAQTLRIMADHFTPLRLRHTWTGKMESIILTVRLPRLLGAALVGAALSLSGAAYQGLFKNPLVSPDLLGISSGACVGAAFSILLGCSLAQTQAAALCMGLITVYLTTRIPRFFHSHSSMTLVLAGVIMSGFMNALLGVAKYVADPDNQLATIVYWTMGSFATARMKDVKMVALPILLAMAVLLMLRWRVNLVSLGEQEAKSLGVNLRKIRGICIVCATVLTACAVCLCGTIGWVGLIMPHMSRLVIGHDNRYLMPLSAILGAVFMVAADTLARNLTGSEIPLSILTGLLGAPLFVWLLGRQKARIS